jgi:hypothetical protein
MKRDLFHPRQLESEVTKLLGGLASGHSPRSHVERG